MSRARLVLAAAASLLAGAGCRSHAVAPSADFEVAWERRGEGRAAVTALCFSDDGARLAVGDYRGAVELVERHGAGDAAEWSSAGDGGAETAVRGEVLLLTTHGPAFVAVRRNGEPTGWGRLSGALEHEGDGALIGWSTPSRKLHTSIAGSAPLDDVAVVDAAAADGRLYLLIGRPPEAARVECRDLRTYEVKYARPLAGAGTAIAVDRSAKRLLAATDQGVELFDLADGTPLATIDARANVLQPLHDGRRVLLGAGDELAVLDLGDAARPPSVGPSFVAHRGGVTAVALSHDGTLLATGGARGDLELFHVRPSAAGRTQETTR